MELVYKRFVSEKKWHNVGFLNGPYLPQYGFGAMLIYLVCASGLDFFGRFFIFLIALSFLEYTTGFIFIKKLGYNYWDYSDRKYNINGIVCLLFSLIWAGIGTVFYYTIYAALPSTLPIWLSVVAVLMLSAIIADFVITVYSLQNRSKQKWAM